jgi:hypothetical protein
MATFTVDSIRAQAEEKYASTDIELADGSVVSLLNPLRLPKAKRKKLMSIQDDLDAAEEDEDGNKVEVDQEQVLGDAIILVADDEKLAKALLKEVGEDMAVLAEIFSLYTGGTQVGEASASQS